MTTTAASTGATSAAETLAEGDFKVADLSSHEFGRNEIRLAEHEMPGLMATRAEFAERRPLAGARITGSLHLTVQTAVLIETLLALGADVRWCSCNIFSTQDHAAAAVVVGPEGTPEEPRGVPVFAWKGETLPEYWWCTEQALSWPGEAGPNMILDDGGDATLLVHQGTEYERAGAVPDPAGAESEEHRVVLELLTRSLGEDSQRFTEVDPISALQAAMDGFQVLRLEDVVDTADIFVTATGNCNVITADHMARMKHQAIVGNIGHFDNEIDMAGLASIPGIRRVQVKPQVDEWVFTDG